MGVRKVVTAFIISVVAVVSLLPGFARADDAQALLAKHRAFVGWQYGDGSVSSLILERTYTDASGKITQYATERRLGLAYRRDYRSTKAFTADGSVGFTGNIFWATSTNGFTVPVIGDTAKFDLSVDTLFMEGTSELPAVLRPSATIDGRSVDVLRITMNGALPFDVYEDPETGAFVQAVIDPDGDQETTFKIASYTDIGPAKKLIGSWSIGDDKGRYTYTQTTLNPAFDAATLHPPSPSATWTFADSQPFPIRVTPQRIYFDAKVNGVPGRFVLDTGASGILLFDEYANKANVKTEESSHAHGLGGTTKAYIRKADTIEIGGNTLHNVIVTTIGDGYRFKDELNFEQPDGFIGFDVFGGAIVNLSLSGGTMSISDPAAGPAGAPPGGYPVTVDLSTLQPRIPVKLEDKLQIMALLDTGAPSLVLMSDQVEHHGINLVANRHGWLGGNSAIGGIGDSYVVTVCGPMARIDVGPFVYTATEACETPGWGLHDGLIGYDFLKHFDYVFDYPHGMMYMTPHKDQ